MFKHKNQFVKFWVWFDNMTTMRIISSLELINIPMQGLRRMVMMFNQLTNYCVVFEEGETNLPNHLTLHRVSSSMYISISNFKIQNKSYTTTTGTENSKKCTSQIFLYLKLHHTLFFNDRKRIFQKFKMYEIMKIRKSLKLFCKNA